MTCIYFGVDFQGTSARQSTQRRSNNKRDGWLCALPLNSTVDGTFSSLFCLFPLRVLQPLQTHDDCQPDTRRHSHVSWCPSGTKYSVTLCVRTLDATFLSPATNTELYLRIGIPQRSLEGSSTHYPSRRTTCHAGASFSY